MKFLVTPISVRKDNYTWMVHRKKCGHALIIDPGESDPILTELKEKSVETITVLITHHHPDHSAGIETLRQHYACDVYGSQGSPLTTLTHRIDESSRIHIKHFPCIEVLAIPGHTLDHVAYKINNAVFCGDTLFSSGCGRLFEGNAEMLYHSLQKLIKLDENTLIYPGHEYTIANLRFAGQIEPNNSAIANKKIWAETQITKRKPTLPTCIKIEKETNPFLRLREPTVRLAIEQWAGRSITDEIEALEALRHWKDNFF